MWFKKEEKEVLTIEKVIEFLKSNSEKIDNHNAEEILKIIVKSGSNKVIHFRVEDER